MLGKTWRKSSRSGGNGNGNCVEVRSASAVEVRDTKDRSGGTLAVSGAAWTAFVKGL